MDNQQYFNELKEKISVAYGIANKARSLGKDPDVNVEALPAGNLAARVEGLVGPKGIASRIKELGRENLAQIVKEILGDASTLPKEEKEERIDQALRTALAIITEGVVAAPIEGISKIGIRSNPDGSEYLSVYFAGPIRSAGGTAQGLAVVIADFIRKELGLQEYRPTKDELERYVEDIRIYNDRVTRLQYLPTEDDIRTIVTKVPVCVDGDPTEKMEVSIHRDLKRVETNRIRGGMCLVIAEGIAQKARKVMKHAESLELDWGWLSGVGKGKIEVVKEKGELKPLTDFMSEIVGGRPVFAAPSAKGAFRLRYGRSRISGIAAKSIHPATMILLDSFIATGTQLKVERPGKGCIATECDSIEAPMVKLKNGSVIRVGSSEEARSILGDVEEILFLGDMLISYGDFLQTNTALLPAGYCEEWWRQEVSKYPKIPLNPGPEDAVQIAKQYSVPLHPKYVYCWEDLSVNELRELANWFVTGKIVDNKLILRNEPAVKRILELLGVPHNLEHNSVVIEEYLPLTYPLGIYDGAVFTVDDFLQKTRDLDGNLNGLDLIKLTSGIIIRPKVGTYLGVRMGRPEKAKERKMAPPVHSLFPIGLYGGKERSINTAAERNSISVDIVRYECPKCDLVTTSSRCSTCGNPTVMKKICPSCGLVTTRELCPSCKTRTRSFEKRDIPIGDIWKRAIDNVGVANVKGVRGMISKYKIPEPMEKGILRAKNKVYVFKDGTVRFDATDVPLTHFRSREVGVGIEKLRELGYVKDYLGEELTDVNQVLELKVQDILIPMKGVDYLLRTSRFIDGLLQKFYGLPSYYNTQNKEDLLGQLVVGLAPHTSAGIVGRVIGFTNANVCFAHPYWHAAKRRNCDGDEDSLMLLMDTLLNFSRKYLPEKRGGQMDAPLVVSTLLDPKEIDDEAHKMEIVSQYPLEFYEATWERKSPSDVRVEIVNNILDKDPYSGLNFTHDTYNLSGPVTVTRYVKLSSMKDKVDAQLKVAEKIRAIDEGEVAELVINSHFIRDTYGNLRAFSRQKFRCVKCNASYRRVPLVGKCTKCGGKLLLTVSEGSVGKYMGISLDLCERYNVSDYLKQRLALLRREIDSLFTNELSKQVALSDFM
ncbi:MAG: DNA polymerase II large subunit [Candidatus Altiarchaeota archaeon]|nr:DNA polymerase II large subunit [Candidatus Altiarchaeota archaeon]